MSSSRTSLTFFLVFFILILNHGAALAEVIHPGETYAESVTWTNIDPVHVVTGNITVGGDATLTIQPGCLVKFESGATISIYGNLQAVGTSGLGITFTSREADGAWSGLRFLSEAIGTLEHCTIERATQGGGGVSIAGADVGIASCLFRNNDYGIYYSITDNVNLSAANTFTDNIFGGVYFSVCANPYVDNQTITGTTGSWGGLFFHETSNFVVGANNTITGNIWAVGMTLSSAPSPLSAGHIPTSGNTNNDGLWVRGGTQDNDYTWPDLGVPYIITYNGTVGPEATLDIAAGASLLFEDFVTLNIYGALNGNGTVADPVLFSRRNEAGGWQDLAFRGGSTGRLEHCVIEHATNGLYIREAEVVVENCLLRHNHYGIYYYQTTGTHLETPNTFTDNVMAGVCFSFCTDPYVDNQTVTGGTDNLGALFFSHTTGFRVGSGNTLTGNSWAVGMNQSSAPSPLSDVPIPSAGNTNNDGLRVAQGGVLDDDRTWPDVGVPYIMTANVSVSPDATLDLGAGVSLLFDESMKLTVYGTLNGHGTATDPILLSRRTATTEWEGLAFRGGSTGLLRHTTVEHATESNGRGIYLDGAQVDLENCLLTGNDTGAYVYGGTLGMLNTTVTGNQQYGLYLFGNSHLDLGSSLAEWNDIHTNGGGAPDRDLRNGDNDVDATHVYWGSVDGAVIETLIHHRPDDANRGLVHYGPWLNAAHDTEYGGGASPVPDPDEDELPQIFAAQGCVPNPFNPATEIRYDLPASCHVRLEVLDVAGRRVATLADGVQTAGHKAVTWQPRDLPSGVYFYRLEAGENRARGKVLLLK